MKISVNNDSLNVGSFSPANVSSVSSSSHVRINGKPIVVQGGSVSTHSFSTQTHSGATMVSSGQGFIRINSINIIVDGDAATCSASHTVNATGFVTVNT